MTDQHKDHMQRKLTTSTTRNQVANKLTEAKEAIKSGTEKASGMFKHKGADQRDQEHTGKTGNHHAQGKEHGEQAGGMATGDSNKPGDFMGTKQGQGQGQAGQDQ